jgi:hypothetical protein
MELPALSKTQSGPCVFEKTKQRVPPRAIDMQHKHDALYQLNQCAVLNQKNEHR